jgi:hypothetical protein
LQTIGKFATKLAAKADLATVREIVAAARKQWIEPTSHAA